jgi:hypothetical protein
MLEAAFASGISDLCYNDESLDESESGKSVAFVSDRHKTKWMDEKIHGTR